MGHYSWVNTDGLRSSLRETSIPFVQINAGERDGFAALLHRHVSWRLFLYRKDCFNVVYGANVEKDILFIDAL
jgi:hypothetical protein